MDIMKQLRAELEEWKEKYEEEEKRKSKTTLDKLDADDRLKEAEQRVMQLQKKESEMEETLSKKKDLYQIEMQELEKQKDELRRNIDELNYQVQSCRKILEKRKDELQVDNTLPPKNINFKKGESGPENPANISYTCEIMIQNPYVLRSGHVLLTFEKEEVAQGIIGKALHNIEFSNGYEEVRAYDVQLGRTVTFEVHMNISTTKVLVRLLPAALPEETLKDKLELIFYRSNIGGGEMESVEYNRNENTACITYQENGVAQRVLTTPQLLLTAGGNMYEIGTSPVIEEQLKKLQILSRFCRRSILLAEIRNQADSEDDLQDLIEIHFQKKSNGGGEVECVAFSTKDKLVRFEEDAG